MQFMFFFISIPSLIFGEKLSKC